MKMKAMTHHFGERARNYRHGHHPQSGPSAEYVTWRNMRSRCNNPKDLSYHKYGGRGIRVCDRWDNSFEAFLEDMGPKPLGTDRSFSIERENNDGNYEPSNCRWATVKEQANNRRSSRIIEHNGESRTLAQWAELLGLQHPTLHWRLKHWSIERALSGGKYDA